jgi:hypothetical protein
MKVDTIQVDYSGGVDGLTIQFDSLLNAKKVFRLHSIHQETINDCAIYKDSLISFAYNAQSVPTIATNTESSVNPADADEDAYVGNALLNATIPIQIIYSIRDGNWNDNTTWSGGMIPTETSQVVIRHQVSIKANAWCKKLTAEPTGKISLDPGVQLLIFQN